MMENDGLFLVDRAPKDDWSFSVVGTFYAFRRLLGFPGFPESGGPGDYQESVQMSGMSLPC